MHLPESSLREPTSHSYYFCQDFKSQASFPPPQTHGVRGLLPQSDGNREGKSESAENQENHHHLLFPLRNFQVYKVFIAFAVLGLLLCSSPPGGQKTRNQFIYWQRY